MNSILGFFVGLLQTTLSLLGFVQQHPELPPAQQQQAQQVAEQVVTQTTKVIANQSASQNTVPTVTVTNISDLTVSLKYSNLNTTPDGPSAPAHLWIQNIGFSKPILDITLDGKASGQTSFTLPANAMEGEYGIMAVAANGEGYSNLASGNANIYFSGGSLSLNKFSSLVVSATSGTAPFTVTFSIKQSAGGQYIDFGDGTTGCDISNADDCIVPAYPQTFTHTYTNVGTYTVTASRHLPSITLGTATINVNGSNQSSISVPGMSKYTDSDFGFSFWYPSGWSVSEDHSRAYPNAKKTLLISAPNQQIRIDEMYSDDRSVSIGSCAKSGVDETYYFDSSLHAWIYSSKICGGSGYGTATTIAADVSHNTMGGLHTFTGLGTFGQNIAVPLSARNFVVSEPTGGTEPLPLMKTIIATDPSVATPVSEAEQTATIQAEKNAYIGQ